MWGRPRDPNGELTGYEIQFYIPDTEIRMTKTIPRVKTFYTLQEGDKLGGPHNTFFRVLTSAVYSHAYNYICLLYTSPSPRDATLSRMPSSA